MTCSKCKGNMISGTANGEPVMACLKCGVTIMKDAKQPTVRNQGPPNPRLPSEHEVSFSEAWRDYTPSITLTTEYLFSFTRNWKIDFCHIESKVAIEIDGLGHGRANRYFGDIDKYNAMAFDGWALFRCTKAMIEKDAERFCRMVAECIRKRLGQ